MRTIALTLGVAAVAGIGCFTEGNGSGTDAGSPEDGSSSGADTGAATAPDTADDDSTSTATPPGMPPAVTLLSDVEVIGEGESVTFAVIVAGGVPAPVVEGGRLLSADLQTEFGSLVQLTKLEYELTLSWDEINAARAIEFDSDTAWTFRAEIDLADGTTEFATLELALTCRGLQACDGQCIDKAVSNDHCGACGNACNVFEMGDEPVGECVEGACTPTFYECIDHGTFANCVDYCASVGQTCAQGAMGQPELGCGGYTYRWYEAANGHACVDVPDFSWASFAGCAFDFAWVEMDQIRCCCTQ